MCDLDFICLVVVEVVVVVVVDETNKHNASTSPIYDQKISNLILSLYHQYAPSQLCSVILNSNVRNYSLNEAIRLIEANKPHNSILDKLARVELYLRCLSGNNVEIDSPSTSSNKPNNDQSKQQKANEEELALKVVADLTSLAPPTYSEQLVAFLQKFSADSSMIAFFICQVLRLISPWFLLQFFANLKPQLNSDKKIAEDLSQKNVTFDSNRLPY